MATTKLYRTFGTPTNLDKWTCSVWLKRTKTASEEFIFEGSSGASDFTDVRFDASDQIQFSNYSSGYLGKLVTNRVFRDVGAWYHIVAVWDSDNVTAGDRMKLYVNGVEETSFATDTNPSSGEVCDMGSGSICYVGVHQASNAYFTGVMAHLHFCDGQAYAASDFGSTDATSGIWVPNSAPSVTYGDNGLFLKFASGAFGTDSSGNSNTMTVSGTMTATKDNAMNNFCTMNPLDNYFPASTFSNGNNTFVTGAGIFAPNTATMGMMSGKWYWEVKCVAGTDGDEYDIGISSVRTVVASDNLGTFANDYGYNGDSGLIYTADSGSAYGNTYTTGDIIGIAVDLTNSKLYFSINGTWQNSGVPTSGATGTGAVSITAVGSTVNNMYLPAITYWGGGSSVGTYNTNFGNGYFGTTAVSSPGTNKDDNEEGDFEDDVPAGYYALCTNNLGSES